MKKILVTLVAIGSLMTASAEARAQHWVGPALIGGVIGYEISRPPVYNPPVVVQQQPPVVIQQQPVVVQGQNCSPWTQVQNPDGSITTTRTCTQ